MSLEVIATTTNPGTVVLMLPPAAVKFLLEVLADAEANSHSVEADRAVGEAEAAECAAERADIAFVRSWIVGGD